VVDYIVDMGRAVTIGEYSGDLAVGGNLTVGGESTFSGDITMSGFPESSYELKGDIDGGIRFTAQAGEALSKGDVVYISGAAGDNTIVSKAQANSSSTMPAFGFAVANASNGASCQIVTFGNLYGSGGAPLNTSAFNVGDTLYVSATTAGGFTSTPPTGESNLLQNIGKIIRSASSNGVIKVGGAGRTNAVPNLDDGDIFIGNASNQAVSVALDTSIVPENGNLYHTTERVQDVTGGQFVTNGTHTGISFTYDDAVDGAIDATVSLASFDTDDLTEGSTNLYYTSTRANADFDTRLATKDTDNLSEGSTNLYYTNARADARIAAASINDLSDVNTAGATSGSVLKWSGSAWVVGTDSPGATVDDATALAIALG